MLDPSWAFTPALLWAALFGLLVVLVVRTIRRDRREYQRFKRYRTTARRQKMMRRWLLDSFLSFGGLSVIILLLAGSYVAPLLQELTTWPVVRDIRGWFLHAGEIVWGITFGVVALIVVVTLIGLQAARRETDVPTIGDIRSMLPRNRQELVLGAAMSVNAGVVEELMFRLALPALIYGASGSAVAAVLGSVLLFGALHLYQGVFGIVGTTVIGAFMMLTYAVSGTILVPILLHVLFDLRSMVLIPVAVYGVHRVDGRVVRVTAPLRTPAAVAAAAGGGAAAAAAVLAEPADASADLEVAPSVAAGLSSGASSAASAPASDAPAAGPAALPDASPAGPAPLPDVPSSPSEPAA